MQGPSRWISLALAFLSLVWVAGFYAPSAAAETILRFNRWVPPTHHTQTRMMEPWAEKVAEVTEGRVRVQFTSSSLGAPPRQFDLAATGVADVTFGNHDYTPARFLLTRIAELPFISNSAEALSVAFWRTHKKFLAEAGEHQGVHVLSLFTHGPGHIYNKARPIRSVGDFEGLKLRVVGPVTDEITETLGAAPISAPVTEVYELLSRGVVDGTYFHTDGLVAFNLGGEVRYQTRFPGGIYNSTFFLVVNKEKWNAIAPADRDAIMEVSGENFARLAGKVWDDQDRKGEAVLAEKDVEVTAADDALVKALREELAFLSADWLDAAKAEGIDGPAALEYLKSQIEDIEGE